MTAYRAFNLGLIDEAARDAAVDHARVATQAEIGHAVKIFTQGRAGEGCAWLCIAGSGEPPTGSRRIAFAWTRSARGRFASASTWACARTVRRARRAGGGRARVLPSLLLDVALATGRQLDDARERPTSTGLTSILTRADGTFGKRASLPYSASSQVPDSVAASVHRSTSTLQGV